MTIERFAEQYRAYGSEQKDRELKNLISSVLRRPAGTNTRGLDRLRALLITSYLTSDAQEWVFEDIKSGSDPADPSRLAEDKTYFSDLFFGEGRSIFQPTSVRAVESDLYMNALASYHSYIEGAEVNIMGLTEKEIHEMSDDPPLIYTGNRDFLAQWRQEIIDRYNLELPPPS